MVRYKGKDWGYQELALRLVKEGDADAGIKSPLGDELGEPNRGTLEYGKTGGRIKKYTQSDVLKKNKHVFGYFGGHLAN